MAGLVEYNFTIDDTSPVLTYSPYADIKSATGQGDGLHNGWQTWYTGSGYLSSSDGPSPVGDSFHLTSLSGASVSLSFYGSGVALYGITNSSYDVTFDGSIVPNATSVQGVLFSTTNQDPRVHNVSLTARPDADDQVLSFNRVLVTSVANSTSTDAPNVLTIDNQNTSVISYTGDWTPAKLVSNIPSSDSPAPFHSTTASGASASLNFTGRAIALYGSSTTNHGPYSVTLDGINQVLNGSSQWLLGSMLMFYQDGLDENTTHTLNLTNLNDDVALSLSSVQIRQFSNVTANSASNGTTHGSSKIGAIVGPVIALVVIASVVALFIWTKCRDKHFPKKVERRKSTGSPIFLPQWCRRTRDEDNAAVSPYVLDLRPSSRYGAQGSFASSNEGALDAERLDGIKHTRDEKGRPMPMTVQAPFNAAVDSSDPVRRHSPTSVPVTYAFSEDSRSQGGTVQASSQPYAPTDAPSTFRTPSTGREGVSPVRSDDNSLVERVLELVAQRIDVHRPSSNRAGRPSVDNLPPYSENV